MTQEFSRDLPVGGEFPIFHVEASEFQVLVCSPQ